MRIVSTKLEGAFLLEHGIYHDARGFFYESYNQKTWKKLGLNFQPVQENHSFSLYPETIRGLHYQLSPYAQAKAVRVITGAIFDVAVDLRTNSTTYGSWISVVLSEENKKSLFIPQGFAHGFCTLTPDTRVAYLVDEFYLPEYERGILWNDPSLKIPWPVTEPVLSEKDSVFPTLDRAEINF